MTSNAGEKDLKADLYPGLLREAAEVADILNNRHYQNMMAEGTVLEFNVLFVPGSLYVQIRIGDFALWDSDERNDGGDQDAKVIEEYCEASLADLTNMFMATRKKEGDG